MKRLMALLLALMCLTPLACAETLPDWIPEEVKEPITEFFADETLLTTIGTVKAEAPIDVAVLSFSIVEAGDTVAEANAAATSRVNTITDALTAQGVAQEQIWRSWYDISPNVLYHNTKFTEDQVIDGYIAEIVLCVRLTDMSLVGVVIDAATQSGAGSTHDLAFERSTEQAVYNEALIQATRQAMERAKVLAEGSGLQLGQLVSIQELSCAGDHAAIVEVSYYAK